MVRKAADKLALAALVARRAAKRYPAQVLGDASTEHHAALLPSDIWRQTWDATTGDAASWLGHCSVLLRLGGMTILTDPVWSKRIGVRIAGKTIGVSRLHAPPVDLAALPQIDLVLLSHAHFDHLDRPTLRSLARKDTRVITAENTFRLVPRGFGDIAELKWDAQLDLGPLKLRAIKPSHWGARTAWDRHRGFNSYLIEQSSALQRKVLFAGDTAMTEAFDHLRHAGGVDLAIMGIGAYDPWVKAHATPEQVWQMATTMDARRILPVHFGTFRLSDEPSGEPMQRLLAAAGGLDRIVSPQLGAIHTL